VRANANEISLGLTLTTGRVLIEELVQRCTEIPSGPKLQFNVDLSDELYGLFTDGVLDAAICYTPAPINAVTAVSLYQQELFLVGPTKILEGLGDLDRRSLRRFPLVLGTRKHSMRKFIDGHMADDGIEIATDFEIRP
jgi:DNA-binding transcriptional LysR family regulator